MLDQGHPSGLVLTYFPHYWSLLHARSHSNLLGLGLRHTDLGGHSSAHSTKHSQRVPEGPPMASAHSHPPGAPLAQTGNKGVQAGQEPEPLRGGQGQGLSPLRGRVP